jgi:hypothetical protein
VLAGAAGLMLYALRPLPMPRISSYTQITSVGQWAGIAGTDGFSLYLDLFPTNGNGAVPIFGGRVVPFPIDLPTSTSFPTDSPILLSVSPDGSRLLIGSNLDPSSGRKLWVVDAHAGGARFLAEGCYGAAWSPDGKTSVYSTLHGDIYTISVEGGEPRLLLSSPASQGASLPWQTSPGHRMEAGSDLYAVPGIGKFLQMGKTPTRFCPTGMSRTPDTSWLVDVGRMMAAQSTFRTAI